jgi:hypothetical protein
MAGDQSAVAWRLPLASSSWPAKETRGGAPVTPRPVRGGAWPRLVEDDKYAALDRRRRRAQVAARHALGC